MQEEEEKNTCLSSHDLTKNHVILILFDSQKSCGQMSLEVKRPVVKCHLWSNVPWSNVTCRQMSHGQMSLAVKCPAVKCRCGQMSQNLEVVKGP